MLPAQLLSGVALLEGNEYLVVMMFSLGNIMGDARKGGRRQGLCRRIRKLILMGRGQYQS